MAKIRRIGVLKMSSFVGLNGFFIMLIILIITWIATKVVSGSPSLLLLIIGLASKLGSTGMLILVPFVYGIIGFISALISTPIMNLVLKIVKGLDFDLEMTA